MTQPSHDSVEHVVCVYCHSPISFSGDRPEGLVCPACGGAFQPRADAGQTTTEYARRLGRFELLAQVGSGAFGTVWKARDTGLGRLVALKLFHRSAVGSPADRERFWREARAAAQLRHPGIVPVHEVTEINGQPVIVADFIAGVTLRDLLRQRRLTFREAAELTAEVAAALDYAHSLGVVHRDVKPANIMIELSPGGGPGPAPGLTVAPGSTSASDSGGSSSATDPDRPRPRALLLDFGLALRAEVEATLTVEGQVLGTPAYMSPEQAAGQGHRVDRRTDVYAVGAVLYELLTGERPFRGTKPMLLQQVLYEEPRPPRRLNDKVPRDLETICLKALAKEPARRYPTAGELAADLRRFLAGEPIRARPVSGWERAWKWARRRPAAAALLVVTPVALLALVGLTVGLAYNGELVRARQAEEGQRLRAEEALEEARTYLYFHRVTAAEREWLDCNVARATELLAECPPERRQWEWHYLDRLCHPELPVLSGHTDVVGGATFSPDGSLVASASYDGTVRLWDAHTGNQLLVLRGRTGTVQSVAFSPDGRLLAAAGGAGGQPGAVQLWALDRPSGPGLDVRARPLQPLPVPIGDFCQVTFSPDGKHLAVASGLLIGKPFVKIFAVDGRRELQTLTGPQEVMSTVAFSPDGRRLAAGGGRSDFSTGKSPGLVQVWDVASGKEIHRLPADPMLVQGVAFSPDGRFLAASGRGGGVLLLDAGTFREVRQFRGHRYAYQLAFSPDGKQLAAGGEDGAVPIWDPATGDELYTLRGHTADVLSVAYNARGDRLVSAGVDRTVRLWDPTAAQEARTSHHHAGTVTGVAFGDDRWLVSGGYDGTVQVWEPFTARPPRVLGKHREQVWCVAVSPDGTQVASGSGDWQKRDQPGEVKVWSRATGEELLRLRAHAGLVWSVTYSPDGKLLATAGGENFSPGEVKVWDARTGQPLLTIPQPKGVRYTVFSPDGRQLAGAVAAANAVKVWNAATGRELFSRPANFPMCLAFSPDGRLLAAGTPDQKILVWDLATGDDRALPGHRGLVAGLAFSPDGHRLASAGGDGVVKLWDVPTGQEVLTLRGHHGFVEAVAFSPDGRRLASAGDDGTVKVWDARPRGE